MTQSHYRDGRNSAKFRMEASDQGVVFEYGHGPESCDYLGARRGRDDLGLTGDGVYAHPLRGRDCVCGLPCARGARSAALIECGRHSRPRPARQDPHREMFLRGHVGRRDQHPQQCHSRAKHRLAVRDHRTAAHLERAARR